MITSLYLFLIFSLTKCFAAQCYYQRQVHLSDWCEATVPRSRVQLARPALRRAAVPHCTLHPAPATAVVDVVRKKLSCKYHSRSSLLYHF